ncbi:MAG: hypothetical protein WAK95_19125 [Desulfobacterales bacterium]
MKRPLLTLCTLAQSIVLLASIGHAAVSAQTRQEHVHQAAQRVMPFDVAKTVHVFEMTQTGGVLRVIAKDPGAADQVALIRKHLQGEAEKFQKGDFGDPASLHGGNMPGLKDLQAGAARIKVTYAELPAGAEITFLTPDLQLLTALHRWFGAQLSEHGADARAE